MIPVLTPEEMAEVDASATEPVDVLIDRAGAAVAWAARRMLGGTYGRRILVLAGPGNNGADGRVAAGRLRAWGARVVEVSPSAATVPADIDLVIDAAFGTGLSRPYRPPGVSAPVLAVDIPSGVSGLTGELLGRPLHADLTVTFQSLKPGLVLQPGASHCGAIKVVDIGLDVSASRCHLLEADDVAGLVPTRSPSAHKWHSACWVVGGSPGMTGAAVLAAGAAARAGAGYVRLSVPGGLEREPIEAVGYELGATTWGDELIDLDRFGALVLGPGLGRGATTAAQVGSALSGSVAPVVVDGDALGAIGRDRDLLQSRAGATVLTPHDGEFELLVGARPGGDRVAAARALAQETHAVVLLKGPATVVAEPGGDVLLAAEGDARLATAGTGDVLAGVIGALLAQGLAPFEAAAAGAWLHGRAASLAPSRGMVASDLLGALPEVLHETHMG